ncbi:META domain-containing protein [Sphingomicrobium flavum]|uniref:META domain-containing protein n=1 Tax=Sphingomicrobium flavum TaxID=1229164 RepID=UPI0021AD6634|nr:META domain-containing protein [Sphingomicrobium flavum]
MKRLCLLPIAGLMACTPAAEEPPVENEVAAEAPLAPSEPAFDINGTYRVVSYRNTQLSADTALTATVADGKIVMSSPCTRATWDYQLTGNNLATDLASGLSGCAANASRVENGVADAISQANIAMEMRGMIQLSGAGGVIELAAN